MQYEVYHNLLVRSIATGSGYLDTPVSMCMRASRGSCELPSRVHGIEFERNSRIRAFLLLSLLSFGGWWYCGGVAANATSTQSLNIFIRV